MIRGGGSGRGRRGRLGLQTTEMGTTGASGPARGPVRGGGGAAAGRGTSWGSIHGGRHCWPGSPESRLPVVNASPSSLCLSPVHVLGHLGRGPVTMYPTFPWPPLPAAVTRGQEDELHAGAVRPKWWFLDVRFQREILQQRRGRCPGSGQAQTRGEACPASEGPSWELGSSLEVEPGHGHLVRAHACAHVNAGPSV